MPSLGLVGHPKRPAQQLHPEQLQLPPTFVPLLADRIVDLGGVRELRVRQDVFDPLHRRLLALPRRHRLLRQPPRLTATLSRLRSLHATRRRSRGGGARRHRSSLAWVIVLHQRAQRGHPHAEAADLGGGAAVRYIELRLGLGAPEVRRRGLELVLRGHAQRFGLLRGLPRVEILLAEPAGLGDRPLLLRRHEDLPLPLPPPRALHAQRSLLELLVLLPPDGAHHHHAPEVLLDLDGRRQPLLLQHLGARAREPHPPSLHHPLVRH
eukprot:1052103-Rhodomonas_salina.2